MTKCSILKDRRLWIYSISKVFIVILNCHRIRHKTSEYRTLRRLSLFFICKSLIYMWGSSSMIKDKSNLITTFPPNLITGKNCLGESSGLNSHLTSILILRLLPLRSLYGLLMAGYHRCSCSQKYHQISFHLISTILKINLTINPKVSSTRAKLALSKEETF